MDIDPKALVRRLTPTATRLLEAAAGRAANSQCYEVVPEHFLATMLEPNDGDAAILLKRCEQDRRGLIERVTRALQRLRTGNAGRPKLSENLLLWLRDAWMVASVERGSTCVRSADLIATFAENQHKYGAETYPELSALPHAALRSMLYDEVPGGETLEAEPSTPTLPAAKGTGKPGSEALSRFTVSFTGLARDGKLDPVLGRHKEIRQLIDILSRRRKNNPILVGEPGVGKTALAEGLALAIVAGDVPESLKDVELVGLDLGALQAGAGVRGEFEQRLKNVIQDVKSSPKPIILFIDEAHTLIGAGGAQGTGDAANLLKPELARGALRTIAATTWSEYKKYFEKDAALERRFQPVKVEEPSEEDAVAILRGIKHVYEKTHGITIRDEALVAAASLSHRYVSGRQLPDKAVDLLDSVAARARTELHAKPEAIVSIESELGALERALAAWAKDEVDGFPVDAEARASVEARRTVLHERLGVLNAQLEKERAALMILDMARKGLAKATPDGLELSRRALATAQRDLERVRGEEPLLHAEADAQAVARVVESWTGIPVGKIQTDTMRAVLQLEDRLRARIRGQDDAVRVVAEAVRMAHAGVSNPDAPRGVLLFVGTSGVGKTETALALADTLYGGDRFLTTIAMSEFQEGHSVSRLIGSPPGYVGYGEGGVLTEAVRRHPYSVVLLDECEKAHLDVMNLFYQVFDKGTLSDGEGRKVDFRNTLNILTSNLATDIIARMYEGGARPSTDDVVREIRPTLSRHFKPALLGRMTIVPFAPMNPEILREIVALKLERLEQQLARTHRLETVFAPSLADELARLCTESESGARNIDHVMRGSLLPALSKQILERIANEEAMHTLNVGLGSGGWEIDLR
jgi:type VI secretion system protein VasG